MYLENRKNTEFQKFFEQFKEKNKDKWASIINAQDIDTEVLLKETFEELDAKHTLLKQFSERKRLDVGIKTFNKEALKLQPREKEHNESAYFSEKEQTFRGFEDPRRDEDEKLKKDQEEVKAGIMNLKANESEGETYDFTKFHIIYLDSSMICKITRLNRIYNRKVLVFAGNKEGMIAYGVGRGPLYEDAWNNAFEELKKNLILVEWDPMHTFPESKSSRYHDFRFHVQKSSRPYWFCNPILILMMRFCGFYHQNFWTVSRKKKPYSLVFALFKLATSNTTIQKICEREAAKTKLITDSRYPRRVKMGKTQLAGTNISHRI